MFNNYEWYLEKDLTRAPPEHHAQLVHRTKSLDFRWNTWEKMKWDPLAKKKKLKQKMLEYDPQKPQDISLKNPLVRLFTTQKKKKESILENVKIHQDFSNRVFARKFTNPLTGRKKNKALKLRRERHKYRPGKHRWYWQYYDHATEELSSRNLDYIWAILRAQEMSELRGDEHWEYAVQIAFKYDTCEFTPWYQHIMKMRRKWRKEPSIWRTVPNEELKLHKYPNDCWTLIKGRVYDITTFLYKHPGGDIPLRQVFGQDGTWVLLGVHPYVVWYYKMPGLEIGRKSDYKHWGWVPFEPIHQFDGYNLFWEWLCKRPHPLKDWYPVESFHQNRYKMVYKLEFMVASHSSKDHWMFRILKKNSKWYLRIQFFIQGTDMWYGHLRLPIQLLEDDIPYWKFSNNYNAVKITIRRPFVDKTKPKPKVKKQEYHNMFFHNSILEYDWFGAYVIRKAHLSEEVILFTLAYDPSVFSGVPIGFYVNIRIEDVIRPYTPICFPIVEDPKKPTKLRKPGRRGTLHIIVRRKPFGEMSPLLWDTPKDAGQRMPEMKLSAARGLFDVNFLFDEMDIMLILAGGTGIAPFTRIIQLYMKNSKKGLMLGKHVLLMYFNTTEKEIIFDKTFAYLQKKEKTWFHYFPILTRANKDVVKNWQGLEGYPSRENIKTCLYNKPGVYTPQKKLKIMICGKYKFIHWAEVELAHLKLTDIKNQFCFLGTHS